ncbi:hypothetical protein [Dickeya dianthicola]|uniref:hypothetical protein n=1 Tax=Dickeya dianthicola TaxID=204039 RepID=UPI0018689022|nr:hypothetical protein [Dickeya dianthicola]QOL15036.1 hypothetical protein HGI48_12995 [Dickeya dianthicola]
MFFSELKYYISFLFIILYKINKWLELSFFVLFLLILNYILNTNVSGGFMLINKTAIRRVGYSGRWMAIQPEGEAKISEAKQRQSTVSMVRTRIRLVGRQRCLRSARLYQPFASKETEIMDGRSAMV